MRHLYSSQSKRRPGVVLLVVMAMLSLFASVALSFVFYADAEAVASQLSREAQNRTQAEVDPELLANYFMSQFIYGTTNPYSAMQGHSLAETMYGYNPGDMNHIPFNGPGRQSYSIAAAGGLDSLNMVNFTQYSTDSFKRTPGFYGIVGDPNYRYIEGTNVPWTAPDRHNMFLSVMAPDGTVLLPSFVRPWTGGIASKYTTLRPHNIWHSAFGTPDSDPGGDVRNNDAGLGYAGGNNDSIWMDLGFPVITAVNGRKYKALFAPLIVDLSNKFHLWAHGNRLGTSRTHTSNVGMGPTEVNLSRMSGVYGAPIARATMLGNQVTITTATPHSFTTGQLVRIAGVAVPLPVWNTTTAYVVGDRVMRTGAAYLCVADNTNQDPVNTASWLAAYDGAFTVTVVDNTHFTYNSPATGMPDGAFGVAYFGQTFAELQGDGTAASLFKLKYNKNSAKDTGTASGQPISFPIQRGGPWYSRLDFNALNNGEGAGARPIFFSFGTAIGAPGVAAGSQTINLAATFGTSYGGFHWTIYAGQTLNIVDPQPMPLPSQNESVVVTAVDHVNKTITVRDPLKFPHIPGIAIGFGSATRGFPYYPPGYQNLNAGELNNDPMALNLLNPNAPNSKVLAASQMESLLRYFGTNSPGTNSELLKRMPNTFANIIARNQVTTVNWSLDRIAGSPYLTFDRNQPNKFVMDSKLKYPTFATAFNPSDLAAVQSNSDFSADWRNTIGHLPRIDLNRRLTDFPVPASQTTTFTTGAEISQADQALKDRQQFALDLYKALVRVVGARDPNDPANSMMTTADADYQASRWLAQLAVNMVDYLDYDDYLTSFKWDTRPMMEEWVFGTELPRLVVSEVYAQYDNDPADPQIPKTMTSSYSNLNLWIEFDNPFANSAVNQYPVDTGRTQLKIAGTPIYQVVVYQSSAALTTNLRDASNPRISFGEPDPAKFAAARLSPAASTDWGTASDISVNATSLYVLGPSQTAFLPSHDPGLAGTVDYASPSMTIRLADDPSPNSAVTILLQRLAVPHLPHQPNPTPPLGSTPYNPFVTVDYLNGAGAADGIPVWENLKFNKGKMVGSPNPPPNNHSIGRSQPYAADRTQAAPQKGGSAKQPKHTFNQQNSPRAARNDWLVHLDRPAINVIEMLHVSGYRPHELTQQFVAVPPTLLAPAPFQHYAPWLNQGTPIYRLLEVVGTANHMAGTYSGGPVPGKINLNTIMDREIFRAVLDPQDALQANPLFTTAQVDLLFGKMIQSRRNDAVASPLTAPTSDGEPFRPFNHGRIDKTWFRPDHTTAPPQTPLFAIPGTHPYQRAALMQKMYNNVTTTSNVFAVWFTVGYFEVVDDSVRPVKLGPEVGRAENRHVRHRFFAIVDRTGLELNHKLAAAAVTAGANQAVMLADPAGVQQPWVIRPGMVVEVVPPAGSTEVGESVVVKAVAMNGAAPGAATIVADFTANHSAGSAFVVRGNPGPTDARNLVNSRSTNVIPAGLDVPVVPNPFSTATWTIQPGMFLQVGSEVVVVKTPPAWESTRAYLVNDLVGYGGKIYRCTSANTNNLPTNPAFWASDTFTADFTMTQPLGATIVPWRRSYTAKQDAKVVLHMSMIQ